MKLRALSAYVTLETIRGLRNRSYLVFSVAFPLMIYLLNTGLRPETPWTAEGLPASVQFMVSMAAFGVIMTALSIGPRIARERDVGWLAQLRVTPISSRSVVVGKILVAMALALPVTVAIFVAGAWVNGVTLPLGRWLAMTMLCWVGAAPFAALGVSIGYVFDADSANVVNSGALLLLAFLGGLFVPLETMPPVVQEIGRTLPSYRFADLAWSAARADGPAASSVLGVVAWTLVLGTAAWRSFRRAAVTS